MQNKFSPHGGFFHTGEISWGTLRDYDLLKSFSEELERLAPFSYRSLVHDAQDAMEILNCGKDCEFSSEIICELMDALDYIASHHGCTFSTSEGDGSSFGFWLIEDQEEGVLS